MTMIHASLSVRGALYWGKRELRDATAWIKRDDGTRYTTSELRDALMDELSKGHEFIRIGDCDNFDPKKGCLGHDEMPEVKRG
jgi:hypothetical protein